MTTKGPIQFATSFPPWTRALVIAEITKTYKLINTNTFKQSAIIIYRNHTPPYAHNTCSKCCTLKSLSQSVSTQVQFVRYEYQTEYDQHGYNPLNYQRHYHWTRSCQLSVTIRTLAITCSMFYSGHDPHRYNPVNYKRHNTGCDLTCYANRTIAIY